MTFLGHQVHINLTRIDSSYTSGEISLIFTRVAECGEVVKARNTHLSYSAVNQVQQNFELHNLHTENDTIFIITSPGGHRQIFRFF